MSASDTFVKTSRKLLLHLDDDVSGREGEDDYNDNNDHGGDADDDDDNDDADADDDDDGDDPAPLLHAAYAPHRQDLH